MRHHHRRKSVRDQQPVGGDVFLQVDKLAPIDRQRQVRVGHDRAVPGKMLGGGGHAGVAHAMRIGDGELRDDGGARSQSAIANDLARAVVEIHARRERQIDAMGAQFGRHEPAEAPRELEPRRRFHIKLVPDAPQRRQQ